MSRLQLTIEEIRTIITKLPDVEETPWGRQLKERWTAEARAEARAEVLRRTIQRAEEDLEHYEEMFRNGTVSESGYRDLKARAEQELQQYRADLARIDSHSE